MVTTITTADTQQDAPATFSFQDTLPRLPIPALKDTCEQLLKWNRVLLDEHEFEQSRQVITAFQQPDQAGPRLHQCLLQWSKKNDVLNWLESLWDEAYLSYRKPLCINSNVFYLLDELPQLKKLTFARQATSLIIAILNVKQLIDTEQLEVDMERGQPLCMAQYKQLFTATRIPKMDCDERRNPFAGPNPTPSKARHIIVFYKGQAYSLNLFTADGMVQRHEAIENGLNTIITAEDTQASADTIGALTTLQRDQWAHAREQLLSIHPDNAAYLDTIETALFTLCLDDITPEDLTDSARNMMHGDGKNRWFDKSFQLIGCPNGVYGVNAEHSGLDGSIIGKMFKIITQSEFEHHWQEGVEDRGELQKLQFQLNDSLRLLIKEAKGNFETLTGNTQVKVLKFEDFGKNRIKDLRVSPDAFVQLALQRAQYRIFGKCHNTYEPVMTRKYLHGRTEAARTVTEESVAFVEAMASSTCDDHTRAELLHKAAKKHVSRLVESKSGKGIQRHLFGMLKMYHMHKDDLGIEEMPEIFTDTAWTRMCHDTFSTSTSDPTGLALAGYGPVVDDGFGVRYVTKNDTINFTMSSRTANTEKLEQLYVYVQEALQEMERVLSTVPAR